MRFKIHSVIPCIYKRDYSVSLFVCLFVSLFFLSFLGRGGERRGGKLKCYRHTDIQTYKQTYRQTYRPSDEAGPRGAFTPKNLTRILLFVEGSAFSILDSPIWMDSSTAKQCAQLGKHTYYIDISSSVLSWLNIYRSIKQCA